MNEKIKDLDVMSWNPKDIPLFWKNEQTGMMKHIVQKFFKEIHLTNLELKYLRWYIVQWIDGIKASVKKNTPPEEWDEYKKNAVPPDYKEKIEEMDQKKIMDYIVNELGYYGLDPF